MKTTIVTICNASYSALLDPWLEAIRKLTDLPITVLCLNGFVPTQNASFRTIMVAEDGNFFPRDLPDHACLEKLRVFEHVPDTERILFIDLDILVLNAFWNETDYDLLADSKLVMVPDLFVGYKEKMEEEFRPYDDAFRMQFTDDGGFFYFNTGVFFASRQAHAEWFRRFLAVWKDYITTVNRRPSIFDQNMINYCLIRFGLPVHSMPTVNNCLRQYGANVDNGRILLNREQVNAYHFNGGDSMKKLERWKAMLMALETGS